MNMSDQFYDKPLFQLTVGELMEVLKNSREEECVADNTQPACTQVVVGSDDKRYVYGIDGIARLFGCSKQTANRIKKSGKIDAAITQIGRKIIVDADKALELAGLKTGGKGAKR